MESESRNRSGAMSTGMGYFGNVMKVTLGAGLALGGAYLFSRVGEKQNTESSLSRLEQMLSEMAGGGEESDASAGRRKK